MIKLARENWMVLLPLIGMMAATLIILYLEVN